MSIEVGLPPASGIGRSHGLRYIPGVATLTITEHRCNGCGICLEVCPHQVLEVVGNRVRTRDLDACMECGACARNCPSQAIAVRAGAGCAYLILLSAIFGGRTDCGTCG